MIESEPRMWSSYMAHVDEDDISRLARWSYDKLMEALADHSNFPTVDWSQPDKYYVWVGMLEYEDETNHCWRFCVADDIINPQLSMLKDRIEDWWTVYYVMDREDDVLMPPENTMLCLPRGHGVWIERKPRA